MNPDTWQPRPRDAMYGHDGPPGACPAPRPRSHAPPLVFRIADERTHGCGLTPLNEADGCHPTRRLSACGVR